MNDVIKSEIEFYKNSYKISINEHEFTTIMNSPDKFYEYIKEKTDNLNITLEYYHEIIKSDIFFDFIVYIVRDLRLRGLNILITTCNISKSNIEYSPLTNIFIHWSSAYQRHTIAWNQNDSYPMWESGDYYIGKQMKLDNRKHKTLISVRKQSHNRDYLFEKISNIDLDIKRYVKYINDANKETNSDIEYSKKFPTWPELQKEYSLSFFTFIVETETGNEIQPSQLSEKTLLAFMNGTLPIILGPKNFIKNIENLGLKVFNNDFMFNEADVMTMSTKHKIDIYSECINIISKLNMDDCIDIWNKNYKHIQSNYDIISELILNE